MSEEASARMEFEPLCDVFCFVLCFGIRILSLSSGAMLERDFSWVLDRPYLRILIIEFA